MTVRASNIAALLQCLIFYLFSLHLRCAFSAQLYGVNGLLYNMRTFAICDNGMIVVYFRIGRTKQYIVFLCGSQFPTKIVLTPLKCVGYRELFLF